MTLIISISFPKAVVIQSDGRIFRKGIFNSDVEQKIFPIAGKRLAISHSGEGQLYKDEYYNQLRKIDFAGVNSPRTAAEHVICETAKLGPQWFCSCSRCVKKSERCNFAFHGLDTFGKSQCIEVVWQYGKPKPVLIDRSKGWGFAHGIGEAVKWPPMDAAPKLSTIQAAIDGIFSDAMTRAGDTCGGDPHSLAITARGCFWLRQTAGPPLVFK